MLGVMKNEAPIIKWIIVIFSPFTFPHYLGVNFEYLFDNIKPITDDDRPYLPKPPEDLWTKVIEELQKEKLNLNKDTDETKI